MTQVTNLTNATNMTTADVNNIFASLFDLGTVFFVIIAAAIALYVLLIIANWKIFTKAGEKGWKSLIPIYNLYIIYKIFWKPSMFWITLLVSVGTSVLNSMYIDTPSNVIAIVRMVLGVVLIVIGIRLIYRTSKSFGHGVGYTIGLLLLPNIFTLVLGFGKSQYKKIED